MNHDPLFLFEPFILVKLKYLLIHHSAEAFYGIVYSFCAVHSPEMFI